MITAAAALAVEITRAKAALLSMYAKRIFLVVANYSTALSALKKKPMTILLTS